MPACAKRGYGDKEREESRHFLSTYRERREREERAAFLVHGVENGRLHGKGRRVEEAERKCTLEDGEMGMEKVTTG